MGVWWSGAGETGGNITNVSPPDSGGSGNGNNQDDQNNQTGETGSSGHKLLDQYNQLVAEGKGGTTQAQNLGRYLGRVEQKKQAEGDSLYDPGQSPLAPGQTRGPAGRALTTKEKVEDLAFMEAGSLFDPENKYVKSFEGQQFFDYWLDPEKGNLKKDDPALQEAWIQQFGMPSIVASQGWGDPIKTTYRTDEFGHELGGEYIYSGLGQALMDQYNQPGFDYGTAKADYWSNRAAAESAGQGQPSWVGGDGGGGGGGGYGYQQEGKPPPKRMVNFYTPQANLQQAMVNVHEAPTGFQMDIPTGFQPTGIKMKRGGIVSLLRLGS